MALEFANQRYLPSLIHNGSFSRGAAYWSGSFLRHIRVGGSEGSGTANAPQYALRIARPSDDQYPDVTPPGAMQFIDRPDLAVYPSSRQVSGLLLTPYSRSKALVQVLLGATAVEGVVLTDKPSAIGSLLYENLFQHPFLHQEVDGTQTRIAAGTEIPLVDTRRPSASGVYRSGRTLLNFTGTAAGSGAVSNVFTYHALEISTTPSSEFVPSLSSDTPSLTSSELTPVDVSTVVVLLTMDAAVGRDLDRQQPGFTPETGLAIGDVFVSYAPQEFVLEVISVTYVATGISLGLRALSNYGKDSRKAPTGATSITSWDIFLPSSCNIVTTMPLYKYDYTVATKYRIGSDSGRPAPSLMELRTLGVGEISGPGTVTALIPRVEETVRVLSLDAAGDVDLNWESQLERFVRESSTPLDGRMDLRILPLEGITFDTTLFNVIEIQKFDEGFQLNIGGQIEIFPSGAVLFTIETPTGLPVDWMLGKRFSFNLDEVSEESQLLLGQLTNWQWLQNIVAFGLVAEAADDDGDENPGFATIAMHWLPAFGSTLDGVYQITLNAGDSFSLVGVSAEYGITEVSDIYVAKGDFTERFERIDDPAYSASTPITNNLAIDFLQHGMDQLESAIPKGMVLMYAGGGVCPPGYKRVDAFPDASVAGVGVSSELPIPDSVSYDPLIDRTTLVWQDQDFPLLDAAGAPTTLADLSEPRSLEVPPSTGLFETVTFTVNQQIFQPGMHIRVPSFALKDTTASIYTGSAPGTALTLAPNTLEFTAGQVQVPSYSELEQELVSIELWFRTDAAITETTVLASKWQRISGAIVGWSILMNTDGTITIEQRLLGGGGLTGGINTFTTQDQFTNLTTGTTGFWRMYVSFSSKQDNVPTLGFDGSIELSNIVSGYRVYKQDWTWGSGLTGTMSNTGPLILGARPRISQNPKLAGGGVTIDMYRQFKFGVSDNDNASLWNFGAGLPQVPSGLDSRMSCELRFDEGVGLTIANTSSLIGALDGASINQTTWGPGLITVTTGGLYGESDYRASLEDRDKSFLIANLKYNIQEKTGSFPSGVPYEATNAGNEGSGSTTSVVVYPDVVLGSNIEDGDLSTPPIGPGNAAQTAVFNDVFSTSGLAEFTVVAQTVVSGRLTGFSATRSTTHVDPTTLFNPEAGDVYWYQVSGTAGYSDSFATRLTKIDTSGSADLFFFDRYDGKAINLLDKTVANVIGGTITIRPVLLYGVGVQALNSAGDIISLGVTQNRVVDRGETYWTTRLSVPDIEVLVQGNLAIPSPVSKLVVEPSGYLRYSDPDIRSLDYGSGGHSHKLDGQTITAAVDAVPRVNEVNSDFTLTIPFTDVAANHGHGILPTYRYPLPAFRLFSLCEKL
jgi:hypothetical protein